MADQLSSNNGDGVGSSRDGVGSGGGTGSNHRIAAADMGSSGGQQQLSSFSDEHTRPSTMEGQPSSSSDDRGSRDELGDGLDGTLTSSHVEHVEDVIEQTKKSIPYCGMEFSSHEDAYNFYNAYAKFKGFGIRKGNSEWSRKKDIIISRTFVCDKEGFKYMKDKRLEGKDVLRKAETRVGCMAKMTIKHDKNLGKWKVMTFIEEHNGHELTTPSKVMKHFSHQTLHRGPATAKLIDRLDDRGVRPATICKVVNVTYGNKEQSLTPQQCQVHLRKKTTEQYWRGVYFHNSTI